MRHPFPVRWVFLGALIALMGFACATDPELNPQPLPPEDERGEGTGSKESADPSAPPSQGAAIPGDGGTDAAADSNDGGDGS